MGLSQRLEMRQGQALVMTPQLLQAIKLLQLSHLDLASYVEAELERNPLLERAEPEGAEAALADPPEAADGFEADGDGEREAEREPWLVDDMGASRQEIERNLDTALDNVFPDDGAPGGAASGEAASGDGEALPLGPSPLGAIGPGGFDGEGRDLEATLTADLTLRDHLGRQLELATADPVQRLIGHHLIDAIDEAGYLAESVDAIAGRLGVAPAGVLACLELVQRFDPTGIGARSLAECLALQLRERDRLDPAMAALIGRLDLVARRDLAALRRVCGVDDEDLAEMLAEIRCLDPKPGRAFGAAAVEVLVPDVYVRPAPDGSWHVELNADTLPRILVNQSYHARVCRGARTEADRSFLSASLQSATWLTKSLEQRAKTILKVATEIVRQQDGFFVHGVTHLRPLNLRTVADAIGMHESTVSRVTSNKSIGTGRGTFEMKYFFTAAIPGADGGAHSSEAVRHRIKRLIDAEPADAVLSDDALVGQLRGEGIDIARRTVAKYRESLRISSSIARRREKQRLGAP